MGLLICIVLGCAFLAFIAGLASSEKTGSEKLEEATESAVGGGMAAMGCMFYCVISVLPFIIGLAILSAVFKSC